MPALLRAAHAAPTAAVTLAAAMLAIAAGHGLGRTALITAAVLAGQLSVGWSNDWFDATRDRLTGRTDKPVATGMLQVRTVAAGAIAAAGVTAGLSLSLGWFAGSLHVAAVAAAWLYNWPLKATAASVAPWAVSFGLLPGFVVAAAPGQPAPPGWLLAAGALLGAGAHFANALPDLADDARTGVHGLPHRLGPAVSRGVTVVLLLAAGAVVVSRRGGEFLAGWVVLAVSGLALATAILTRRRYGERQLFRVVLVVALADVALLLTAPL